MALTLSLLFPPVVLSSAAADVLVMPSSPGGLVLKNGRVRLANTSAAAVAVTLYNVPASGSEGPGNVCLPGVAVPPNGYLDVDIPTLAAGGKLRGSASAAGAVVVHEMGGALWAA